MPSIQSLVQIPDAEIESLLRPFRAQSAGDDLVLLPADRVSLMLTGPADDFPFRAVAVLFPQSSGSGGEDSWTLRRRLFDRGLIAIGTAEVQGSEAVCFLASDAIQCLDGLEAGSRGHVSMATLTERGRFANQLFRYSCAKLYALREGLTAAFPDWEGRHLFGLDDPFCAGLELPRITFEAFSEDRHQLWESDDPPRDVDLDGYFQELPECWRRQRPLLRRLFQLPGAQRQALGEWRERVTEGGRRTLVAIHVRRGDYREIQHEPWFRMVPEQWYLDWLRNIWPTLREPLLFVATDEPEAILPMFGGFETVSVPPGAISPRLPDSMRDFEILQRADLLAICNSSFSRMAALLAPSTQKCFIPSFESGRFEPYEPWIDPAFWARFAASRRPGPGGVEDRRPHSHGQGNALMINSKTAPDRPLEPAIYFDLSDLLLYVQHHTTVTGIQRVQFEILRHVLEMPHPMPVRFAVLNQPGEIGTMETSAVVNLLEGARSDSRPRGGLEREPGAMPEFPGSPTLRRGDVFLLLGAFWNVRGMGRMLQDLKNSGVIIGLFLHDILPITNPEFFEARDINIFVKGVTEALTFADFILTTSEFNRAYVANHIAARELVPIPIHAIAPGDGFPVPAAGGGGISRVVAEIAEREFVLCVGTIEGRKNPTYLFNIWKAMVASGRDHIPYLVFTGRKGWLVQDFQNQLKACNYLGGKILVLHNVTDIELELLYRKCILTMFPSFLEGWGLPVGESLSHGKVCLCSPIGGIPELGGALADYIDPYNVWDGLEQLTRYLDDPELRANREREIAGQFEPRPWRKAAEDLMLSAEALARQIRPFEGVAAIALPPDLYLPISSDAAFTFMNGMGGLDGTLSAELACISGWHAPEAGGVRAAQSRTAIRFRADAEAGTRIQLALRLSAHGADFHILIRSGSGGEAQELLRDGCEARVVAPCEVEPGKMVTAELSLAGGGFDEDGISGASYWMLKGLAYSIRVRRGMGLEELNGRPGAAPEAAPRPEAGEEPGSGPRAERIVLRAVAPVEDGQTAASFGGFLESANTCWVSSFPSDRDAPVFADRADRSAFYAGCGRRDRTPPVGRIEDCVKLIRRNDMFVSMARFSEGSVFDRSGVRRGFGFCQQAPAKWAPWFTKEADGFSVSEESLDAAPLYDDSYLIFYNGNLHNYYHWVAEGLVCLDVLSRAMGRGSHLKIAMPKTVGIAEVFDHRESLRAIGLGELEVVEVDASLIRVREAIWVESDLVEHMPAPYLKDFRNRIAALYGALRTPRNRRLLIARKGPARKIHNMEELEDVLSRYGFETVYLEGMSVTDQIRLFQGAEFVIGAHGAGMANLLFCEPGTKVLELMPSVELRPFFWLISEKLDLVHGLEFCDPVGGGGFESPIRVDAGKLEALIRMLDAHC